MQDKQKVLIIDDEEMHLYTAKGLLESDRIEVVTYRGAFGATNSVRNTRPNLLLLDVNMPGLSGDNLVSLVLPYCKENRIPVLFYSSNDENILKNLVEKYGVDDYICKGDLMALRGKVDQYLNGG